MPDPSPPPPSAGAEPLAAAMREHGYVADRDLATALHLARALGRPLLIEGEAGVGKTEIAKTLAAADGAPLVRLQCHEGLDASHALYDWDYRKQLLEIQRTREAAPSASPETATVADDALYAERFLVRRPLLDAISAPEPVVLLIDEVDRADEGFEALLLEVLSDFQITVPELGTFAAVRRPTVILTSNGVRELSDALRRRCLYHWLDFPDSHKERRILEARLPGIDARLAEQVVLVVQNLRGLGLRKVPGVAETLDWAAALLALHVDDLRGDPSTLAATLATLVKTREDRERLARDDEGGIEALVARALEAPGARAAARAAAVGDGLDAGSP